MNLTCVRYCANCGAKIERMYWDEYVYKKDLHNNETAHGIQYFCGWNCMREYEKKMQEVKRHGKGRHNSNNFKA